MKNLILNIILLLSFMSFAYSESGTIDMVIEYKKGFLPDSLIDNPNFPNNIFGIPSRIANKTIPANSMEEVQSIGMGGEIIVGFKNRILKNGPGVDFIIFENAFINPVNNGIFAEPGIVSVSQDGINFVEFPFNTTTLKGFAGINYTNGDKDPFNPAISGGDAFDLDILGLNYIRFIKIKDTTELIKTLPKNHKYWNPEFLLTGFDLDAIVGLYLDDESSVGVIDFSEEFSIYRNGKSIIVESNNLNNIELKMYDLSGNLRDFQQSSTIDISLEKYPTGLYIIDIICENRHKILKFIND